MAKKATELDATIYIKQLVDAGVAREEAEESVSKLISTINTQMADDTIETKQRLAAIMISKKIAGSRGNKFRITVVASTPRYDGNAGIRKNHIKEYQKDAEAAFSAGLVKIIKDEIVSVDNREFWDEAKTRPNKRYGKPYPVKMQRDIIGIYDGNIVKIVGDITVKPSYTYDIVGNISEKSGVLYANVEPTPVLLGSLGAGEFYDMVHTAAMKSDIAMDVDGALTTDERGIVLVKGYIHSVAPMSYGKHRMVINNEVGSGFGAFPSDDAAEKAINESIIGADVIAVGRMRDPSDPQYGKSMNAYYVVVNPKTGTALGEKLEKLKGFDF